jgi:hypothetical protein
VCVQLRAYGLVSLDMTRLAFQTSEDKYSLTPNVKSCGTQLRVLSAWEEVFISGMWDAFSSRVDKLSSIASHAIKFYLFEIYFKDYVRTGNIASKCSMNVENCLEAVQMRSHPGKYPQGLRKIMKNVYQQSLCGDPDSRWTEASQI